MRIFLYLVVLMTFMTAGGAWAQSTVYNKPISYNNPQSKVYNKGGAASGPISIKNMIKGSDGTNVKMGKASKSADPYSFKSEGTTGLRLTAAQLREKKQREYDRYKKEQQKNTNLAAEKRQEKLEEQQKARLNVGQIDQKANQYKAKFQPATVPKETSTPPLVTAAPQAKPQPVYIKPDNGLKTPPKVFTGY